MSKLAVTVHDRLDSVDAAEWASLFRGHPDSLEIIRLAQKCGMDGFAFGSIVVRDGDRPILLLPLFEVRFRLATLLEGRPRKIVQTLEPILRAALAPRMLGVGIVEGEWGQAGVAEGIDTETLRHAWDMAHQALHAEARKRRAGLIVFLNFTPQAAEGLPAGLSRINTIPCARLPIRFDDCQGYLQTLSKNMRKDLRRKLKSAADIEIVRPVCVGPWLDQVQALYQETLSRAPLTLGAQRDSYFRRVMKQVPGAQYVLYTRGQKLLAFNLLVERDGMLIDKYFGMNLDEGKAYSLYFVSWMENVRYCCEKKLSMYHAGPGAEAVKSRLGAEFIPSITLFRHRDRAVHYLLSKMTGLIAYEPAVAIAVEAEAGACGEKSE